MAASFPGAIKSFSAIVNGVTKLVAALYNSVYDEVTAIETALGANLSNIRMGAWVNKTTGYGAQKAATDGFVVVLAADGGATGSVNGYTDGNADPTTLRCSFSEGTAVAIGNFSFTMPVKKNDYWKVTVSNWSITSVYWIPLGG